ncbi:MAG: high-potential iron-sulfur protein [Candidatus Tumulicola sp.]
MPNSPKRVTRGEFVQSAVVLPALAGLLFTAAAAPARAAKGSQAQFKYQSKPNGSKKCSNCTFYIQGKTATANGTCKIVEGVISPNGYCSAYSAKSS